jgi:hypothetical protein
VVKVIPKIIDYNLIPSDGEKLLLEKFQSQEGGSNWTVIHSLDIFPKSKAYQTEADFVVLAPGLGIIVVEVKAHRDVDVDDGNWYMSGKIVKKTPVKQASSQVYFLIEYLKARNISISNIPVSFVVWFTHLPSDKMPKSIQNNPAGFLGAADLNQNVFKVLTTAMTKNASALNKRLSSSTATVKQLEDVLKVLSPSFSVVMKPEDRQAEVDAWLKGALEEQLKTVSLFESINATLVTGGAGTGKTHIAIHEAKKAQLKGERTLFVCFNRLLADHISDLLVDYPMVKVITASKLFLEITGLPGNENSSNWWKTELPKLAAAALEDSPLLAAFDTLIMDEAQDLATDEFLDVFDLLLVDGLAKSRVRMFGDFKHQGIYVDGDTGLANLKRRIPSLVAPDPLSINCRNCEDIGTAVMSMLNAESEYSGYRRKDLSLGFKDVYVPPGGNPLKLVSEEVSRLLKVYSPEQIVVLSSSREKLSSFSTQVNFPTSPLFSAKGKTVRFGTVQEFKGMESLAVVLVEFEDTQSPSWQTLYIASTRATSSFTFVMTPKTLEKVLKGN